MSEIAIEQKIDGDWKTHDTTSDVSDIFMSMILLMMDLPTGSGLPTDSSKTNDWRFKLSSDLRPSLGKAIDADTNMVLPYPAVRPAPDGWRDGPISFRAIPIEVAA